MKDGTIIPSNLMVFDTRTPQGLTRTYLHRLNLVHAVPLTLSACIAVMKSLVWNLLWEKNPECVTYVSPIQFKVRLKTTTIQGRLSIPPVHSSLQIHASSVTEPQYLAEVGFLNPNSTVRHECTYSNASSGYLLDSKSAGVFTVRVG